MADVRNTGRVLGLDENNPAFDELPTVVSCPKCGRRTQIMSRQGGFVDGVLRVSRDLTGTDCGHKFSLNEVVS